MTPLTEIILDYLIHNDPVRANLKDGQTITGILFDTIAPIYNPDEPRYFRNKISQGLSSVRRRYSDPREQPCFYYKKVNGLYEIISTDARYAKYFTEEAVLELKPHLLAFKKKMILHRQLTHQQAKQLIDKPLMQIELALGTREKVDE